MTTSRRGQWAWGGHSDGVKTYEECMGMLIRCAGGDGNMLLNVGPMPNGEIAPEQANRLKEIGAWLGKYGESIYGSRGGPYKPAGKICCTCKGNVVYLHVLKWSGDMLALAVLPKKIRSAGLLGGGEVKMTQRGGQLRSPWPRRIGNHSTRLFGWSWTPRPLTFSPCRSAHRRSAWARRRLPRTSGRTIRPTVPTRRWTAIRTRWAADSGVRQAWLEVDLGRPTTFTLRMARRSLRPGAVLRTTIQGRTTVEDVLQGYDDRCSMQRPSSRPSPPGMCG